MADKPIRQRIDPTVVHKIGPLDGTTTSGTQKLDIVCKKITVELNALNADIDGSLDGNTWFEISSGSTGQVSYGAADDDHLVKWIKVTRNSGSGTAVIVGV